MMAVFGSLVAGSALGGVLAGVWGITAPFWFGFVGSVRGTRQRQVRVSVDEARRGDLPRLSSRSVAARIPFVRGVGVLLFFHRHDLLDGPDPWLRLFRNARAWVA